MNAFAKFVLSVCIVAGLAAQTARAQVTENWYAMVAIRNSTDLYVTYSFKWGDGFLQTYTLAPGETRWHSWRYDYPNQNHSPIPYVRFDSDLSSGYFAKYFPLTAYATPYEDSNWAKAYHFRVSWDRCYLELSA